MLDYDGSMISSILPPAPVKADLRAAQLKASEGETPLEFYYYEHKEQMYARARAYVGSWKSPAKTPNVKILEARVNDEVTHLGWKRLDAKLEDKTWHLLDVINELLDTTAEFLAQLDWKFYREGLTMLETEMNKLRVKQYAHEGKRVLAYYDLFDAAMKSVSLS
jgi:hypothetical protein